MEQRHDEQRRRLQSGFRFGRRRSAHRGRDPEHDDVLQVRDRLPMCQRRTLRCAGRARRIRDGEQVVFVDRRVWNPGIFRERGQVRECANGCVALATDLEDMFDRGEGGKTVAQGVDPATVGNQDTRT